MSQEQEFFASIAARNVIRIGVRAIVVSRGHVLVQKPTDDPSACYSFLGGGYELGDTFVSRLKTEFEEETNAHVVDCRYLFVVENRLLRDGSLIQGVEHYFDVTLDRDELDSREDNLAQYWLPVPGLKEYDLRPWVVRDIVAEGRQHAVRHLVVPLHRA